MVLLLIVVNNIFITIFGDRGNEIHLHICNSWKLAQCSKLRKKQIHPRWNVFSTILDNANGTCDLFNRIMIIVEICLALYWLQELQIFTGWIILLNAQSSFNTSFKKKRSDLYTNKGNNFGCKGVCKEILTYCSYITGFESGILNTQGFFTDISIVILKSDYNWCLAQFFKKLCNTNTVAHMYELFLDGYRN